MRDLALRFARAFEGFGLSTSLQSPRWVEEGKWVVIHYRPCPKFSPVQHSLSAHTTLHPI